MWYGVVACISRIYDSRDKPRGTNVTKKQFHQAEPGRLRLAGGAVDPAVSSATYEIAWVRVYQK